MTGILIFLAVVWVASPVVLFPLWLIAHSQRKRQTQLLQQQYLLGKVSVQELQRAGVPIPKTDPFSGLLIPQPPPNIYTAYLPHPPAQPVPVPQPTLPDIPAPQPVPVPQPTLPDIPAPQPVPVPQPALPDIPAPQPAPVSQPAPSREPIFPQKPAAAFRISAISVMLSVGVVLIIVAGLLFVRSQWQTLGAFGRLAVLASGSILFFGASAMARRIWKLRRTGMAFFSLGAAFLPISVWAAGYFSLLGSGLSGAGNPRLIALAFASFTVIAYLAILIYQQVGWGVGFLLGLSASFQYFTVSLTGGLHTKPQLAVFMTALTAFTCALTALEKPLRFRLPDALGMSLKPIAYVQTAYTGLFLIGAAIRYAVTLRHDTGYLTLMLFYLTILMLTAVLCFRQIGWGGGFWAACSGTYQALVLTLTAGLKTDLKFGIFLFALAVFTCLLSYVRKPVQRFLPQPLSQCQPYAAMVQLPYSMVLLLGAFSADSYHWLYAAAVVLTAVSFFAQPLVQQIKQLTALPVSLLGLLGFALIFAPLYDMQTDLRLLEFQGVMPFVHILTMLAVTYLLLLMLDILPAQTTFGFQAAGYALTGLALLIQMFSRRANLLIAGTSALLMLLLILRHRRGKSVLLRSTAAAQGWLVCMEIRMLLTDERTPTEICLLMLLLSAVCFVGFYLPRKLRSACAALLFPLTAAVASMELLDSAGSSAVQLIAALCLILIIGLYLILALEKDTAHPVQFVYAGFVPVLLALTTAFFADCHLVSSLSVSSTIFLLLWNLCSTALGLLVYRTIKRRFTAIRKTLFSLLILSPLPLAILAPVYLEGGFVLGMLLISAASAVICWRIFSNRGLQLLKIISFSTALFLLVEETIYASAHYLFEDELRFTCLILAALWVFALSVLSVLIRRRSVLFVGSDTIPQIMQIVAPLTAFLFACLLRGAVGFGWEMFYAVCAFALCVTGWFTTKRTQLILPGICGISLILTLECVRAQYAQKDDAQVVLLLLGFAGMTALFPYLGMVLREDSLTARENSRSFVMTAMGGMIPVWLIMILLNWDTPYSDAQREWMVFFVPMLLGGYILHFITMVHDTDTQKHIKTAAAGLWTAALLIQPLFDVDGTYFAGKLHLIPLILFGIVLRRLYGSKVGSGFLFGIGVYSMLRLGGSAIATETGADLLTVLITALVMFILSFYIKQKKWFLLGGISLLITAFYMHLKLVSDVQWWGYLLFAGLILICIAGANEMAKQKGESLKTKAGRLWDDWSW